MYNFENKRLLILGGNGFVGKTVQEYIKKNNIKFEYVYAPSREQCDLFSEGELDIVLSHYKPDVVLNCSAKVGGIQKNIEDPYHFLLDNLKIQNNVIDCCGRREVPLVIQLASSCIYPKDYIQPLKEEYLLKAPLEETNEGYALAKIAGVKLAEYANKQFKNTRFITLMPSNLYGEFDTFDLKSGHALSSLILKVHNAIKEGVDFIEIWGTGSARREWSYAEDIADCILWSLLPENSNKLPDLINVGIGTDVTMNELGSLIINSFKRHFPDTDLKIVNNLGKPEGMKQKLLDVSKINDLGWKAKTSLTEGIDKTVDWYLKTQNTRKMINKLKSEEC